MRSLNIQSTAVGFRELNILRTRYVFETRNHCICRESVPPTTSQGSQLEYRSATATHLGGTAPTRMGSYIQLPTAIDGQDCDPTPQQRAVYNYHEALHSDAADDIYSFEWFQRTKSFFKQFARSNAQATTLTTWEMVEDLDFGAFFLAHPVAAYSLWHLLQSCYELDRVVCGTSRRSSELSNRGSR